MTERKFIGNKIYGVGNSQKHSQILQFAMIFRESDKPPKGEIEYLNSENEHPITFRSLRPEDWDEISERAKTIAKNLRNMKETIKESPFPDGEKLENLWG